jgi:hypothetical protein
VSSSKVAHIQDADVERAAAQIEHENGLVALLVQTVGQRRRRGLVDDAEDLETRDRSGVLGRGALSVVEVGRHGDDGLGHLLAEELRAIVGELAQDLRADLLRRVKLALDVETDQPVGAGHHVEADRFRLFGHLVEVATDEPLRGVDRSLRVQNRLSPSQLADQAFAAVGEGDDRRRRP